MAALDNFEGVTGVFGFNENGDPTVSAMGGNIVRGGNIEYIGAISPDMVEAGTCDTAMP